MEILMPQLGETVAEGKITTWFKSVGDAVKSGDNLFEIETDKVSMEVPAVTSGVLSEIRVKAGEVAKVGGIVAVIADGAASSAKSVNGTVSVPKQIKLDPFQEVRTPERNFGKAKLADGVTVTPMARRLASELGVDLSRVRGSGPHGRIVANDVRTATVMASTPSSDSVRNLYKDVPFTEVPVDAMRRVIARRLIEAKQTVPHFYLTADVDMDRAMALREEANASLTNIKLSLNDFIVKAFAIALQRVPAANSIWAEDRMLRFQRSDIGVAVAIDGGLLTPVIRGAETKSLSTISAEMKDLAARARERKLLPSEYQGGAASISNLGMFGVRAFSGIINPPQSTLLAVGAASRRPVEAENGGVRFVTQMTATLSCDHRVVDGALGAELLAAFKNVLEHPVSMLI